MLQVGEGSETTLTLPATAAAGSYIDLICEDTIDEKIVKALRNKINIASEVMGEELRDWI